MRGPAAYPLARAAQRHLDELALMAGAAPGTFPPADRLMTSRAARLSMPVADVVSSGGGCRLHPVSDGHVAINLARDDDWDLLPALVGRSAQIDTHAAVAAALAPMREAEVVARGRLLGLAVAGVDEVAAGPALQRTARAQSMHRPRPRPRVIDLSALWAGPLAGQLLRLAGCEVIRVESPRRPDRLRESDPVHFDELSCGKGLCPLDLSTAAGVAALAGLIAGADIVIEAARPRALGQLGIDADRIVAARAGLTWITITGHGVLGDAANWIGFGDDAAVAGGLSHAARAATGRNLFVGDALADPLGGIAAARAAMADHRSGRASRIVVAMSGMVREAIAAERAADAVRFSEDLALIARHSGQPFAAYLEALGLATMAPC